MTQPDTLHTRLRDEINRRLTVARAATPGPWAPDAPWLSDVVTSALLGAVADCSVGTGYRAQSLEDARYIALHDPADAIRRYSGELELLERHAPKVYMGFDVGKRCGWCSAPSDAFPYVEWPCAELKALAHRLGVSVDG